MNIKVEKLSDFQGHAGAVYSICGGEETHYIFSGSSDKMIAKWNLRERKVEKMSVKMPQTPFKIAFSKRDNALWAGQSTGDIMIIDTKAKKPIANIKYHKKGIFDILFSQDETLCWVAAGDGMVSLWDAQKLKLLKSFQLSEDKVRTLCFYDDKYILAGSRDGVINVINIEKLELEYKFFAHRWAVNKIVVHPQKKNIIITGGKDAYIRIFDLPKEKLLKEIPAHNYAVYDLAFNKGKTLMASASRDRTVKLWDLENFDIQKRIDYVHFQGHRYSVNTLFWEHASDTLLSCSDDKNIIAWKVEC